MAQRIQLRLDTAENWTSVNPILAQGEAGYEIDTNLLKIGDGSTAWNSLSYFGGGGGGGSPDLESVLTEGNDGGALQIKNIADPTDPQDATTKAYVDAELATQDSYLELNDTPSSYALKADHAVVVNSAADALEFVPTLDVSNYFPVGVQDKYVGAELMYPTTTAGCAALAQTEISTVNFKSLDFDTTTEENAQFTFSFPRNWDRTSINVSVYWTAAAGSGGVAWGVKGVAISNDDPIGATFGGEVVVVDTLIATNDLHISDYTADVTIGGTPIDSDFIVINIARKVGDAGDTIANDVKLLGVSIKYVLDAAVAE
jgi:hypothetical protein